MPPPAQRPPPARPPFGGNGGSFGGGSGSNGGSFGNTATVRCESRGYRYQQCSADTRDGVRIARVLGGDCRRGNWGWRQNLVWVDNGCRADFAVHRGSGDHGGGPSTGAVIGGVAIAAGLIALLAASNRNPLPGNVPTGGPPARIDVPMGGVTPDARPALRQCLAEAARQVGATGGREIGLDRFDDISPANGGWRFDVTLTGSYPDGVRRLPTRCRASSGRLIDFAFG